MANRQSGPRDRSRTALDANAVAEKIRAIPASEGLAPGDRIGAEREFAERFGVGRWIVRRALEQLEAEGVVLRTTNGRGGGVFVAPRKVMREMDELMGLPHYVQSQGMTAGTTVLGTQLVTADEDLAQTLQVDEGAWLYRIDRLRLAAELPLSVETVWIPVDMFPGLLNESLVGSIYDLLEDKYDITRGEAVEKISSCPATKDQAAILQVPAGAPLLVVTRHAHLSTGPVFETTVEYYRADRISLLVHTSNKVAVKRKVLTTTSP